MNVSEAIIQLIHQNGKIKVPGFGKFSIYIAGAVFDNVTKTILPPEKQYKFIFNYLLEDNVLAEFLAKENRISVEEAKIQIAKQVEIWKTFANEQKPIDFEEIGKFISIDGKYTFKGNPVIGKSPDFFGLEKININEINKNATRSIGNIDANKEYMLNQSFLWIFLLVIPILAIIYLAFTQKELIFGKKSFDFTIQNSTHRIKDDATKTEIYSSTDNKTKDSVQTQKSQSQK